MSVGAAVGGNSRGLVTKVSAATSRSAALELLAEDGIGLVRAAEAENAEAAVAERAWRVSSL